MHGTRIRRAHLPSLPSKKFCSRRSSKDAEMFRSSSSRLSCLRLLLKVGINERNVERAFRETGNRETRETGERRYVFEKNRAQHDRGEFMRLRSVWSRASRYYSFPRQRAWCILPPGIFPTHVILRGSITSASDGPFGLCNLHRIAQFPDQPLG
jgi:hypothetical protein